MIRIKDVYGGPSASTYDTVLFTSDQNTVTYLSNEDLINELRKIKAINGRDKIVDTLLSYAFIEGADTLFASPRLDLWLYQNKIILYRSEVFQKRFEVPPR